MGDAGGASVCPAASWGGVLGIPGAPPALFTMLSREIGLKYGFSVNSARLAGQNAKVRRGPPSPSSPRARSLF